VNTEQAIEVIECEKGCAEADLANNEGHINTERFIDACNMALAALRNQQEREKGCEYCRAIHKKPNDHKTGDIIMPDRFWYTHEGDGGDHYRPYRYCPECGRKLRCD